MNNTFDDYIKEQIKEGYLQERDIQPIKCTYCESKKMEDYNHSYLDGHLLEEYQRRCKDCKKLLGVWSYGSWFIQ